MSVNQHLLEGELVGLEHEPLELHDYVNLQECHEMMQMQQQLYDERQSELNHMQIDPVQDSVVAQKNTIYCINCQNR